MLNWGNNIDSISNQKLKELAILKRFACFAHFIKKIKIPKICELLPLSRNQIKKSFEEFRKGTYSHPFQDKRGQHKKEAQLIDEEKLNWLKDTIPKMDSNFRIKDVQDKFREEYPDFKVSKSTIHKTVTQKLNFEFKRVNSNPIGKNAEQNKKYRFWFCHYFMQNIVDENVIVSIDESSYSFYKSTAKKWITSDNSLPVNNDFK